MSQYGSAAKNPPWVRSGQAMGLSQTSQVGQTLMGQSTMSNMTNASMLQYPQVFQGQMAAAQQMYGAVQYPTRALNSAAFSSGGTGATAPIGSAGMVGSTNSGGQQHASNINDQNVSSSTQAKQQRVFTGTVTKVQDNFGFVDNDVFFQSSCCVKGSSPQVGDRVLVEAVYNSNMPFKWNATRIQVLPVAGGGNQQQSSRQPFASSGSQSQMYSAVPPPSQHNDMIGGGGGVGGGGGNNSSSRFSSRFSSNERSSGRDRSRDVARDRGRHQQRDQEEDRKRRRDDSRNRNEREDKDRGKSPARKRSKSPQRAVARRSTQQRRPPPRYSVVVPKISLASTEADVIELRKRYSNLYIPSDFFLSKLSWTDTFPINKPLSLDLPCNFHVMHKDVDPLEEINAIYEPSDADYLYSAKVMLFSSPGLDELFTKCCRGDEHSDGKSTSPEDDSPSPTSAHPSRLLSFLVGTRNREFLAIGGPWSPSLDGPDPTSDPGVLVKTAVRTCKALTGIDLSACTQWFRFLEVHYHRSETTHHGRPVPARVETVVMFVPDVWSICPSQLGWDEITAGFKTTLANKLNPPPEPDETSNNNNNNSGNDNAQSSDEHKEEEAPGSPEKISTEPKKEPKHHSELDPKNMRVSELREELEARCLSPKGLKTQLAARLAKVIKTEAEEEQTKKNGENENEGNKEKDNKDEAGDCEENTDAEGAETSTQQDTASAKRSNDDNTQPSSTDKKKKEDESESKEKKKMDDRDKVLLEKRYRLPDTPQIIVHPNRTFKAGKFDCAVVSLSALLGYRQGDTKEHAFEVSLFAELFNEMLMRDFGFYIYKAVIAAPERPKEEKNREKDDDRKKDKTKEKDRDSKDKESKDGDKDKDKDKDKSKSSKDEKKEKEKEEGKMEVDEAEDENTRESTKKEEDKKKDVKKLVKITDQNLLLSFSYFDTTRGGYIYDRDLEDLLFSLGLALSRSQLRKLIQKVATKDSTHYTSSSSVHYRKLAEKTKEEGAEEVDKEQATLPDELIWGNKVLLAAARPDSPPGTPTKKRKQDSASTVKKNASGMVEYNGTLIDVGKLMDQLSRSEHTRVETEKSLAKLRTDYNKLKESSSRSDRYIKDLTTDIKDYKERLYNSNSDLCTLESKQKQFHSTLSDIQELIRPLLKSSSHSGNSDPDVIEVKRDDNGRSKRRKIDVSSTQPTEIVEIKEDDPNPGTVKQEAEGSVKSEEK